MAGEVTGLIVGAASLLTTLAAVPLVRTFMLRRGIIDVPNRRSSHNRPIPRGGGVACAGGILSGSIIAAWLGVSVPVSTVVAAMLLAGLGLLDDRFHLAAAPRLAAQIIAGALLGATIGGVGWAIVGAIVMPLLVNVVNFMDGINGITALTLLSWGCTTALAGTMHGEQSLSVLGAVTAGAALGFLPFNAPRARIFLGDVGSYLFGALATGGVMLAAASDVNPTLLVAPLVISVTDVLVTLARRAWRGARIMEAHREHIYQRLAGEGKLPHLAVSLFNVSMSLIVVLTWSTENLLIAAAGTFAAVALYVLSPLLRERAGARRSSQKSACVRTEAKA